MACSIEVYFGVFQIETDSSDEKEMILKQNLDVLVPKHIGTINFACHLLEQIQWADWGAIVFGSWVDAISNYRPRLPKTGRATLQAWLWEGIENRGFKQIKKKLRPNASNNK